MKFDIWTFLFQVINFVVLLFILKRLLYKPVKEILEKRRGLIQKTIEDAERTKKEALELKKQQQQEVNKLKTLQPQMIEDMKKEVMEEKKKLLIEAKEEAAKIIDKEKALFEIEKKKSEDALKDNAIESVSVFASNLLKDISDEELNKSIYRKFLHELEGISSNMKTIEDESVSVDLAFAYPLDEEELRKLEKALEQHLSKKMTINTNVDGALIAGLKIKLNDWVYDFSLKGQIDSLSSRLREKT
jgi:F-type H+-transporting ATPase subunit b